ncbi:MAG: 5'/3'-nucleotidase SurE [Dehalococcoidales bacterium]|nr:5'/3'-nucleotidase SurE [Dehalococcoidales bacterium]
MNILLSNDDGILSPGLWTLAKELQDIAQVTVVAPDREQSATGTMVTLRQPLRVHKINALINGIDAYAVEGTPGDSVIIALEMTVKEKPDLVISGINQGLNTGDDILISGTVGAALQGYLRDVPAIAVSVLNYNNENIDNAARLVRLIAEKFRDKNLSGDFFLNINIPDYPVSEMKGIKITRQAHKTHIDTVKEGHDGKHEYYWLVRQQLNNNVEKDTDIYALKEKKISITPLNETLFQRKAAGLNEALCNELFKNISQH